MECNEIPSLGSAPAFTPRSTVLVVDDDDEIRELLADYLSDAGYHVLEAADGQQMWAHLRKSVPQLVVLDLMLPGEDGLSLCRQLQRWPGLGVIMLSARGSAMDRIVGLEVGADDYVCKPFEPRELLARVKAVLRRAQMAAPAPPARPPAGERFCGFVLEHSRRQLVLPGGATAVLPRSDYRVLRDLLANPGRVLGRDRLSRAALGREFLPEDRSVDMCISRLRQHLRRGAVAGVEIVTVRNEGYLLSLPGSTQ